MKIPALVLMALLAILSFPPAGLAAAPPYVPIQGMLTDSGGLPIEGEVEVLFSIYGGPDGEPALWSETQSVTVDHGLFAVYLGQVSPLDLSVFKDNSNLRLGITVGQDQEMPRIFLGSSPFAGYAEYAGSDTLGSLDCSNSQVAKWSDDVWSCADDNDTDTDTDTLAGLNCQVDQVAQWNGSAWACATTSQPALPSGVVMFFNLPDCPPGFSELPQAAGRYLVGRPAGGVLGAAVGSALSDQENRAVGRHGHTASAAPHSHGLAFYNYSNDNFNGSYTESGPNRGDSLHVTNPADVSVTVAEAGPVAGTAAPYLQFTVCVKD